jgi:hypothetical protein
MKGKKLANCKMKMSTNIILFKAMKKLKNKL